MLGEGPTYGINGSFGSPGKKFMVLMEALDHQKKILVLILVKQTQNLSLHYNADNSYLFADGK